MVIKMTLQGKTVGFALTGSFCTYQKVLKEMEHIAEKKAIVLPIFSNAAQSIDCRFGTHQEFLNKAKQITGNKPITTIETAEPIGPKSLLDIMLIAPCTGNSIAKLANAITDTPVLMAAKAHLRNQKPLVIFISTNDGLGINFKNIGSLYNCKNIYYVPFGQDDYKKKPTSLVSHAELIVPTLELALESVQLQPVIQSYPEKE